MKNIPAFLIGCVSLLLFKAANAQSPRPTPASYNQATAKINSIQSWTATAPEPNPNTLFTRPLKDVKRTTMYTDGLGRPIQSVIWQGSLETATGNSADLVSPFEYDEFGRMPYQYLPFASTATDATKNDGSFKYNAFQQQVGFYNAQLAGQAGETNVGSNSQNWAYNKTNFEPSPLDRVTESYAAGVSWVGSEGSANPHPVRTSHWTNTAADNVKVWAVTNSGTVGVFGSVALNLSVNSGIYPAGSLVKEVTTDEAGHQTIEFRNMQGKTILKKVQLTASADNGSGGGHLGWLSTYFIYDDLDNLRCVIQPEAVRLMENAGNWSLTPYLNEQCFRYEYDQRNRMIMKKSPGAGEVYMVYDQRDLLVMTQDANIRANNQWMYTKYDAFDRPVQTGVITNATSFATHLQNAYTSSTYPTTTSAEILTETFYDNYSWLSGYGNPLPGTYTTAYDSHLQSASNSAWPYPQANVSSSALKNLATGRRTRVLGTSTYLYNVIFYDDKGRVIQEQSTNYTGGTDVVVTQYSWIGQPLVTVRKIQKADANPQMTVIATQATYDYLGRPAKTEKKLSNTLVNGGSMSAYKTVAQSEYDKLGRLRKKTLSPSYNSNAGLENLVYDYNVRGWLLGANREFARDANNTNYFGFDLGYDKADNNLVGGQYYTNQQFTGNIEGMTWKSRGDGEKRRYDFTYDAANRLSSADFNQYASSAFNKTAGLDFSVSNLTYDANGNILSQNQMGWKIGGSTLIDQLTYTYNTNSNKLLAVTDAVNDYSSVLGDFKYEASSKTSTDYGYDANGNLNADNNKKITSIAYNWLNLPGTVTVAGKGTITYVYDALGNKLSKTTVDNTSSPAKTTKSQYLDAVFENDVLQYVPLDEGRIRLRTTDNTFQWDYFLKDHLGNVRMTLTEEVKADAYPAATMESASISNESSYYTNLSATQYAQPGWFSDPMYSSSSSVARVRNSAATQKVGPAILLKVMAGDSYNIRVASGWSSGSTPNNSSSEVLTDLVAALSNALPGLSGGKATPAQLQNPSAGLGSSLGTFLAAQNNSGAPKAYINWVLLDEQFRIAKDAYGNIMASGYSGAEQVGASGTTTLHVKSALPVAKNGYLYIYTSNEATNIDVFFDNLQVTLNHGVIADETHYYPFGLTMAGISSKAAGSTENRKKFNEETELNNDLDVAYYETAFRSQDPQLGRFWQVDPMADFAMEESPYGYASNNPLIINDPLGLTSERTGGEDPHVLPVVTITYTIPRLSGGPYNNMLFASIKPSSFAAYGYSHVLRKEYIPNDKLEDVLQRWISESKKMGDIYAAITALSGGSITDLKSLKDYASDVKKLKSLIKNLIKLKKIPKGNPLMAMFATVMGFRAAQAFDYADAIANTLHLYYQMHGADPSQQKGLYLVHETTVTQTLGGFGGTDNLEVYDVSSGKYIRNVYAHY